MEKLSRIISTPFSKSKSVLKTSWPALDRILSAYSIQPHTKLVPSSNQKLLFHFLLTDNFVSLSDRRLREVVRLYAQALAWQHPNWWVIIRLDQNICVYRSKLDHFSSYTIIVLDLYSFFNLNLYVWMLTNIVFFHHLKISLNRRSFCHTIHTVVLFDLNIRQKWIK